MFLIKPRISQTWYIVFEDTIKKHWYTRYLKKGFSHCYLMQKSDGGFFWNITNPVWSHVLTENRLVKTFPSPRDYAGEYATIVEYSPMIDPYNNVCILGINSCVDVIKRAIGLKIFLIFTPYQLFKYLRRL